jgi:hypothetical protein
MSWAATFALALPAVVPLAAHVSGMRAHGYAPTGFVQSDMPYYLANARRIFDGSFNGFYSNPNSYRADSPKIYFQPLILLLGVLVRVTGAQPGFVFQFVGVLGILATIRVALALCTAIVGPVRDISDVLVRIGFVWGGGLLAVAGVIASHVTPVVDTFQFDPEHGWWFLNLGRNFIYPTEAWYHAIALGAILAVIRRRYGAAVLLGALMSVSHPFTGIELLGVLLSWALVERFWIRSGEPPRWFAPACAALAVLHVAYYLVFLPTFPEHRQVQLQWTIPWVYPTRSLVLALCLVAVPAGIALTRSSPGGHRGTTRIQRVLLALFLVVFALSHHDWVMRPVEPIHFARGYDWIALYLLGAPVIRETCAALLAGRHRVLGVSTVVALTALLLSDNALWVAGLARSELIWRGGARGSQSGPSAVGYGLSTDEVELMHHLGDPGLHGAVLVTDDLRLSYLATVYTPLRPWVAHYWTTPWALERRAELRAFADSGRLVPIWSTLRLAIVSDRASPPIAGLHALLGPHPTPVFANRSFAVYLREPGASPAESTGAARGSE